MPIVVNGDGIVLDGHHRFRACQELEIEPRTEVRRFADPLLEKKFVIEANLKRRHLNDFQRIELALKLKPIYEELAKKNMTANLPTVKHFTVEEEVPKLERVNNVIAKKLMYHTCRSIRHRRS